MTTPKLCAAGVKLRAQINRTYKGRDKTSDGWRGDARHSLRQSDHNPDANGVVRALDIDADLDDNPETMAYLADQLREIAKTDRRISYVIYNAKIASPKRKWAWRKYDGVNPHHKHLHVSFTKRGDENSEPFKLPMLERPTK